MTDVMTRAKSSEDIKQGTIFTHIPNSGEFKIFDEDFNYTPHVSGYQGAENNNYLDDRLDDYTYYTTG